MTHYRREATQAARNCLAFKQRTRSLEALGHQLDNTRAPTAAWHEPCVRPLSSTSGEPTS